MYLYIFFLLVDTFNLITSFVITMLECSVVGEVLYCYCIVYKILGPTPQDVVTPDAFLSIDMTEKALSKATFDNIPGNDVVACFKVMPRSQLFIKLKKILSSCHW